MQSKILRGYGTASWWLRPPAVVALKSSSDIFQGLQKVVTFLVKNQEMRELRAEDSQAQMWENNGGLGTFLQRPTDIGDGIQFNPIEFRLV